MQNGGGKGKRGSGRGKGGAEKGGDKEMKAEESASSPSSPKVASSPGAAGGAGLGIPDFKENPTSSQSNGKGKAAEVRSNGNGNGKFNAKEALQWMAQRNATVTEAYEKQKQSGVKNGDIASFQDIHSTGNAWANSRPLLPGQDDFLKRLQEALRSKVP